MHCRGHVPWRTRPLLVVGHVFVRVCVGVEGVAYTFGLGGGVIVYSFPDYELPDARRDDLALGLVTSQRSAVILRVVSGSSSDFIQMELVRSLLPTVHPNLCCFLLSDL